MPFHSIYFYVPLNNNVLDTKDLSFAIYVNDPCQSSKSSFQRIHEYFTNVTSESVVYYYGKHLSILTYNTLRKNKT